MSFSPVCRGDEFNTHHAIFMGVGDKIVDFQFGARQSVLACANCGETVTVEDALVSTQIESEKRTREENGK